MAFMFKKDVKAATSVAGKGIGTGVHKMKVLAVVYKEDKSGNPRANIYLEDVVSGGKAMIFGLMLNEKYTTGGVNYDYPQWQEFAQCCGMETGAIGTQAVETKKDTVENLTVFTECTGKIINIGIQIKTDINDKNEKSEEKVIARTFLEDGRSLSERETNSPATQIEALKKSIKPFSTKRYLAALANGTIVDLKANSEAPAAAPAAAPSADIADMV